MSNETQHTPADVRERAVRLLGLAMERAEWLCRDVGRAEWPLSDFSRDMLQERLDTVRDLIGDALAALRSEAPGDGPVGAVCANCGAPNAAIAGGELDPDEAVCSVECYEQLMELGCPQEHGGTYRPKPARRGEGGGDGE